MASEKDVVQHIREEDADYYSDDDLFSISSWGADLSFRELIQRYEENTLVKPELQRRYVWDKTEASRFIDSILLGLPVPSIFLAKTPDEQMLIVDGYQRIMTVFDYVRGIFSGDDKVFRLARSERINQRWRGKAFSELSDIEQRKLRNTTIHAIIFVQQNQSHANTALYQIFERINTSGKTLLSQEIRNCIYQGSFNELLFELNAIVEWRHLYGLTGPDSRMRDMEFILRYFALTSEAFAHEGRERISLKRFLSTYMAAKRHAEQPELTQLRARFVRNIQFLHAACGNAAFHNQSPTSPGRLVSKFSPTIFDSMMIATDRAYEAENQPDPDRLEARRRELLGDDEYRKAISVETMRVDSIRLRISKAAQYLYGV